MPPQMNRYALLATVLAVASACGDDAPATTEAEAEAGYMGDAAIPDATVREVRTPAFVIPIGVQAQFYNKLFTFGELRFYLPQTDKTYDLAYAELTYHASTDDGAASAVNSPFGLDRKEMQLIFADGTVRPLDADDMDGVFAGHTEVDGTLSWVWNHKLLGPGDGSELRTATIRFGTPESHAVVIPVASPATATTLRDEVLLGPTTLSTPAHTYKLLGAFLSYAGLAAEPMLNADQVGIVTRFEIDKSAANGHAITGLWKVTTPDGVSNSCIDAWTPNPDLQYIQAPYFSCTVVVDAASKAGTYTISRDGASTSFVVR